MSFLRGRLLLDQQQAKQLLEENWQSFDGAITWGGMQLPLNAATGGFLYLGTTGSGKTINIRLLMQSVIPSIGKGIDRRAVIFDSKQNQIPILRGMTDAEIHILNPFDKRCVAWDIAADCTSLSIAREFASIFIPIEKESRQPFFYLASQEILTGIFTVLHQTAPNNWDFRDVVNAFSTDECLRTLFRKSSLTAPLVEKYLMRDNQDILATASNYINAFSTPAALWSSASRKISLKEWIKSESILLLGGNKSLSSTISKLNQAIISYISKLTLDLPDSTKRQNWFFLDDFRNAGKLDGLTELFTEGRSKGACIVLGLQDLEGIKNIYGEHLAFEMIAQCSNIAVMRLTSPHAAKWASELFGDTEEVRLTTSRYQGENNIHSHIHLGPAVLDSEFTSIPPASLKTGAQGFYISPFTGAFQATVGTNKCEVDTLLPVKEEEPGFMPRPEIEEELSPWTLADMEKFQSKTARAALEIVRKFA